MFKPNAINFLDNFSSLHGKVTRNKALSISFMSITGYELNSGFQSSFESHIIGMHEKLALKVIG